MSRFISPAGQIAQDGMIVPYYNLGGGGGVTDGDKGDITVSGGGTVWNVDTNAFVGETLTGPISINGDLTIAGGNDLNMSTGDPTIYQPDDASSLRFGVNPAGGGPQFQLFGATHPGFPGQSYFDAGVGTMHFRFSTGLGKALHLPASGDLNLQGFSTGTPVDVNAPDSWLAVDFNGSPGFIPWHGPSGGAVKVSAAFDGSWNFDVSTTAADPGNKDFRLNNAVLANVTEIYLNDTTVRGFDISTLAGFLAAGNRIYVQQRNNAANVALFAVSGAATDNGGWWTVPVTVVASATMFDSAAECSFLFLLTVPGGGGGGSATTIEVDLGATAKWTGKFTITDAGIGPTSKVLCWQAPGPYTGKGTRADEAELQPVLVIAVEPATGSAVVKWQTPPMVAITANPLAGGQPANAIVPGLKDPQSVSGRIARRLGRARGNVKFSYTVLS